MVLMEIFIADKLSNSAKEALEALGANIHFAPEATAEKLPELIGEAEVLIVRSTKVHRATFEAASKLALVIRGGAGVNTIDLEGASEKGVAVCNTPGMNGDAVAELAMGFLIAADRRIVDGTVDLRKGVWNKQFYSKARGLKGRTLGVIGFGAIGQGVANRAKAFGMKVVAYDIMLTPEKANALGVTYASSAEEVAAQSYALTVHLAATKETAHLISNKVLGALPEGAIFINTSRGEVVDTQALKKAIQAKGLRAALDVYEDEPAATDSHFKDSELAGMIIGTHHIGASTDQASEAVAEEVVNIVRAYKDR